MKFSFTCQAGLESVLKKEIDLAGYNVLEHAQTLVRLEGDMTAIAKLNLRSRVGNKFYLELAKKNISDFDGLFALMSQIDWKLYVQGNPIVVNAQTRGSLLTSTPTIQSIAKKAIVKKILNGKDEQLPEDQNLAPVEILVHLENNQCSILLNTTGESLHKRGYKKQTGEAPINESLAAGLLLLSGRKFSEPLYDFFCGSGTIAIEAALLAKNIAPGSFRTFAFQKFTWYDQSLFTKELETAKKKIFLDKEHIIIASDLDPQMIKIARENAKNAGVEKYIHFETKDVKEYTTGPQLIGTIVSNPPYGIRMHTYDLIKLYRTITEFFASNPQLHGGIITSFEDFQLDKVSGTWKKSVFYNGGEQCRFYKKSLL